MNEEDFNDQDDEWVPMDDSMISSDGDDQVENRNAVM